MLTGLFRDRNSIALVERWNSILRTTLNPRSIHQFFKHLFPLIPHRGLSLIGVQLGPRYALGLAVSAQKNTIFLRPCLPFRGGRLVDSPFGLTVHKRLAFLFPFSPLVRCNLFDGYLVFTFRFAFQRWTGIK